MDTPNTFYKSRKHLLTGLVYSHAPFRNLLEYGVCQLLHSQDENPNYPIWPILLSNEPISAGLLTKQAEKCDPGLPI